LLRRHQRVQPALLRGIEFERDDHAFHAVVWRRCTNLILRPRQRVKVAPQHNSLLVVDRGGNPILRAHGERILRAFGDLGKKWGSQNQNKTTDTHLQREENSTVHEEPHRRIKTRAVSRPLAGKRLV